jgi:hypothetical protein
MTKASTQPVVVTPMKARQTFQSRPDSGFRTRMLTGEEPPRQTAACATETGSEDSKVSLQATPEQSSRFQLPKLTLQPRRRGQMRNNFLPLCLDKAETSLPKERHPGETMDKLGLRFPQARHPVMTMNLQRDRDTSRTPTFATRAKDVVLTSQDLQQVDHTPSLDMTTIPNEIPPTKSPFGRLSIRCISPPALKTSPFRDANQGRKMPAEICIPLF